MSTTLRSATMEDLAALLTEQQARKLDVVAHASQLTAVGGGLRITGSAAEITEDGVTPADGFYRFADVAIEHLADKLKIPVSYLRRMHEQRVDLFDDNVNGWLHGIETMDEHGTYTAPVPDPRKFLCRLFRPTVDEDGIGIVRGILSDRYKMVDHNDVWMAALDGATQAGVDLTIHSCDLTDRRMYIRVQAPSVEALAPDLLRGYRSPWSGDDGTANPVVFAGFLITNSEVGEGSATITPQIVVRICTNGMTMTKDALRAIHLGKRHEQGVVTWSDETRLKELELIRSQAADTVRTFCNVEYVQAKIAELNELAGIEIKGDPAKAVEVVTNRLSYSDAQRADVLAMFVKGGQLTAGGIMQAVTAAAQTQPDGDAQAAMEADAIDALTLAAGAAHG
jgi:hypothetical protein